MRLRKLVLGMRLGYEHYATCRKNLWGSVPRSFGVAAGQLTSESVSDWYLSVFCDAARFDAYGFSAVVMPKTNSTMLYIPTRIDLPTCLAHESQRSYVSASLTKLSRNVKRVRGTDQRCGDVSAHLTNLACSFKVDCFSPDLVLVLADSRLRNS